MRARSKFLPVLGVILLGGCAPARDADPRVARIRERLHLTAPYEILEHVYYRDGGSSSYEVRGANRRRLSVYWDGRGRLVDLSDRTKHLSLMERYNPIDTIPRLLYLGGLREKEGAVQIRSAQESTLIDLLSIAAEQRLGKAVVARIDSLHDAGSIEGLALVRQSLDEEQRRYTAAAGLVWGLREQRVRGYWMPANDPRRRAEPASR